jgi:fatty acid desaturase
VTAPASPTALNPLSPVEADLALPPEAPTGPPGGWRPRPDPALLRACTRVSPWRSALLALALHAAIAALAWAGGRGSGWWLAPLAVLLVAGLQHHLLILLHEGAHGLLHPDRRRNDLLADVLCAVPFFTLARFYRRLHLLHHKHAGSALDPEREMYAAMGWHHERRSPGGLLAMFLADLCGLNLVRFGAWSGRFLRAQAAEGLTPFGARDALLYALVWGPVLGAAGWLGLWAELVVFWFLPLPTLTTFVSKLHGYLEHTAERGPSEYERTLVHELHPLLSFLLYPLRSGYHLEHHLFPRVPWYRMDRLREALARDPEHVRRAAPVTVDGLLFGPRPALPRFLLLPPAPPTPVAAEEAPAC